IPDRHDLLGRVIRDLAAEFLLERHHELDGIEAVGTQIVDKTGVFGHLRFVDAQMLDDDLFDPLVDVTHPLVSSLGCLGVASALGFRRHPPSWCHHRGHIEYANPIARFRPPRQFGWAGLIAWPYRR